MRTFRQVWLVGHDNMTKGLSFCHASVMAALHGGSSWRGSGGRNPVGVGMAGDREPKVARASQPRALGQNPVGIHDRRPMTEDLSLCHAAAHEDW